ncbi:MAG: NADH-quinone oxidoreductase subunit NuoE [Deltaproteobacteria bacterium]|nr:NADH-quinone oxidoreductase subunit NuoE [Deltaproteobacteria bacterium]
MAIEFSPDKLSRVNELISRYPHKEAAVLPVLYLAQEEFGYLSPESIEYVAKLMGIPMARLYGTVSFYSLLYMKPMGRHHIQVCRTFPCALLGAEKITDSIKKKLGIEIGETTADGKFTLSEVECLASCGTAPMMQINDKYYENLSEEKTEAILKDLK